MLTSLPVTLLVGTVLGFLSGLGIGGGSLLILWLTLVTGAPPETARTVNLLFFLPSACIACLLRIRAGTLQLRPLFPAILAGCAAAAAASVLGTQMEPGLIKKMFGFLLIAAGIRELCYRPRNAR